MAEIRYIKGNELDKTRWDRIVRDDPNGNLFGTSGYLDLMTDGWDAIIYGDYEALLPLPVRKRFGFRYIYTLSFCGPFHIYGPVAWKVPMETILDAIPKDFIRCDINLWTQDPVPDGWVSQPRINHLLDLSETYKNIRSRYSASGKNLLNRGMPEGFELLHGYPITTQLEMAGKFGGLGDLKIRDKERFAKLCRDWPDPDNISSLAIVSSDGRALAGAVFLGSHHRIHYLLGWSNREGRRTNAARFLIDHIIQYYAGQPVLLDFEGSDISGVARFFASFGAVPNKYKLLRRDQLPIPVKVFFMLRDVMSAGLTAKSQGNEGTLVDQS